MGKVFSLNISEKKGTTKKPVASATLTEGHGFEGDAHSGTWHRQVSLLGVFSTTGQAGAIVMVRNERRRLVLGDSVEGWRLVGVTAGQAVFERGRSDAENNEGLRQVALELERNTHE